MSTRQLYQKVHNISIFIYHYQPPRTTSGREQTPHKIKGVTAETSYEHEQIHTYALDQTKPNQIDEIYEESYDENKPAAQAAGADASRSNSTNG